MNIIFFLLIIILLIVILHKLYIYEEFTSCDYDHLILKKEQITTLKELLENLIIFFNKEDIKYFAIGGTLIGTIRNGGFMPFDDDIDLGILIDDVNKINNYNNDIYYFKSMSFGYKFFKKNEDNIFIDVMVFENKNDAYRIINNMFPNEFFLNDELLPLKTQSFSELININIPNNSINYLNRSFKDWENTIVLQSEPHFNKESEALKKIPNEFNVNYDNSKYLCYSLL